MTTSALVFENHLALDHMEVHHGDHLITASTAPFFDCCAVIADR